MNPNPKPFPPDAYTRNGRKKTLPKGAKRFTIWTSAETHEALKGNTARVKRLLDEFAAEVIIRRNEPRGY